MSITALLLVVALLAGNAFFVGAEFAIISARRTQLEPLARAGSRRAKTTLSAMSQVSVMLAGAQLGITLCMLALGAVAEPSIAHALYGPLQDMGVPENAVHPIGFGIALALASYLHMVIGEMVPKNLAVSTPERIALWLAPPLLVFVKLTRPILVCLNATANAVLRLFRIQPTDEVKTVYTAEELASLVSESHSEGLLGSQVHQRIKAALTITERTAAEVTIPWRSVRTVSDDISPASLEVLATRTGLSRFPVVDRQTRQVRGFVHVKDALGITGDARLAPISPSMIRPLKVVPPTMQLVELLPSMRHGSAHLVLISEGGSPQGVVTLDDVLAKVVAHD